MADNWEHTVFYSDLSAPMTRAQDWAHGYVFEPLDVTILRPGALSATTDAQILDANYVQACGIEWDLAARNNVVGLANCHHLAASGECEKHQVRYDNSDTSQFSDYQRVALVCHELGHSFGLDHNGGGCMQPGASIVGLSDSDQHAMNHWYDPSRLNPGEILFNNVSGSRTSSNDRYRLVMQTDGNLVLYHRRQDGTLTSPIWATYKFGNGNRAIMQSDGNFVVYDSAGGALWSTGTQGCGGSYLDVQNDRNLVVYGCGTARWASGTNI